MSEFTSCDDCSNDAQACSMCIHQGTRSDMFIPKPKQKIIDLSMMAGSDIDMEFSNFKFKGHIFIGRLSRYDGMYSDANDEYDFCRIRQDHWHSFKGDKCPLPEGLIISYSSMSGTRRSVNRCTNYSNLVWSLIYEFKVLGTADDARYEWEKELCNEETF